MLLLQFIIIQSIIFAIVIFLLKKIMLGSTESAVNRLNDSYEEINKKKEELAEKIKQAEQEYQTKKAEAEKIADKIRDEADQETTEKKDEILKKAREEAERIIADTMQAVAKIREEIFQEEQLKLVDYCNDLLNIAYKDSIRDNMDKLMMEDFLEEFKAMDVSHMPSNLKQVEIITRKKISDEFMDKFKKMLKEKIKYAIEIKEKIDEKVLAGVIFEFGSLVLDGSLAGKIKEASTVMKEKIEKE